MAPGGFPDRSPPCSPLAGRSTGNPVNPVTGTAPNGAAPRACFFVCRPRPTEDSTPTYTRDFRNDATARTTDLDARATTSRVATGCRESQRLYALCRTGLHAD